MQRVINFSGGRSSGLMTILEYKPGDIVLFNDTGREHPKTYKFINDFEAFENIPITRIAYEGAFEGMLENEGYKTTPNRVMRYCTKHLKVMLSRKYLLSIGIKECQNLIGFRYDEKTRVFNFESRWLKYEPVFPLYDAKISKDYVNNFWTLKPYTLEIPHILGNCDLCFMKGTRAIIAILKYYPEFADKWIADEKRMGGTYFKGITYEQLRNIAQNNLFKDTSELDEAIPEFNCACTN